MQLYKIAFDYILCLSNILWCVSNDRVLYKFSVQQSSSYYIRNSFWYAPFRIINFNLGHQLKWNFVAIYIIWDVVGINVLTYIKSNETCRALKSKGEIKGEVEMMVGWGEWEKREVLFTTKKKKYMIFIAFFFFNRL